ncbi:hypothetical protein FB45DRAFT_862162 [Roridomyces roridus]|uniref:Alpha/beta hydrolase n=1 Tax=Roridomyces roridus TaxID=1738132 RepID=A0AAD7FVI1_9AGAR|nr:hypothetical protein FB45DRAFT_862162 [Roridomyces roridus]
MARRRPGTGTPSAKEPDPDPAVKILASEGSLSVWVPSRKDSEGATSSDTVERKLPIVVRMEVEGKKAGVWCRGKPMVVPEKKVETRVRDWQKFETHLSALNRAWISAERSANLRDNRRIDGNHLIGRLQSESLAGFPYAVQYSLSEGPVTRMHWAFKKPVWKGKRVFFVHGTHDPEVPPSFAPLLRGLVAEAQAGEGETQLMMIENGLHDVVWENPEDLGDAMVKFLVKGR